MRLRDGSGVAAVANGEVERAGAGNGDDGCSALRWLLRAKKEAEAKRKWSAAECGRVRGVNVALWPAWPRWAGRWRCAASHDVHAAALSCRCRPLMTESNGRFSLIS